MNMKNFNAMRLFGGVQVLVLMKNNKMEKKNYLKGLLAGLSAILLTACGNNESILGRWEQPVPGLPMLKQGFILEEGGKASSLNMATLLYDTWKQEGSSLILSGTSKGNRLTLSFSDTMKIERLTQDSLILKRGELVLRYARSKSTEDEETTESIPASVITPAGKTQTVKG